MSCILSQLNILCTSLVRSHYTENDNSPVIHHSHVMAILVFSDVLDFVEAVCSIYQNVQLFIRSKIKPKIPINLSHNKPDQSWKFVTPVCGDAEK